VADEHRIINESGYDVSNLVPVGQESKCSVCGRMGLNPFCDTENGCAPVCRNCYDAARTCPCCGRLNCA